MAKLRVAYEYTEAEDKSIRLGLFLIISGVVSLFIFGFCWLSPALQALQATAVNCTVLSVQQIGEVFECTFTCGADCRGTSQYPCVQVYVNNSESNSRALLHSDEHQLLTNPKVRTPRAGGGLEVRGAQRRTPRGVGTEQASGPRLPSHREWYIREPRGPVLRVAVRPATCAALRLSLHTCLAGLQDGLRGTPRSPKLTFPPLKASGAPTRSAVRV